MGKLVVFTKTQLGLLNFWIILCCWTS